MTALGIGDLRAILGGIASLMTEKKGELVELDNAMGDGDLGLTMEKGFETAREESSKIDDADLGRFLVKIGMAIARSAPSTMGTLVATGFMAGGKAVGGASALGAGEMARFFDAFTAGVMQRGKSKPGEKTIVDVLFPASRAFAAAVAAGSDLPEAFRKLGEAAAEGRMRSKEMVAQHGRPAYYREKSKGQDDPGAVACLYILQGFCHYIGSLG
jgi:dihydroxyacetone kinase-like protein